ncbi:MAG: mevalonate kinase [Gammaproteobacteria bacterium]|nr:mevalonate kinase [Gammaproteobacteria bacterium]
MKVLAPGKLILSGEHSVVYGQPALAMAVNRYVTVTATPQFTPHISFDLTDFAYQSRLSLTALDNLKNRIKQKYKRFLKGDYTIRRVLHKPVELAQVAFTLFVESLNIKLTQGINIHMESTIPVGCGMGSSAATVLSIAHAIANYLEVDLSSEMFLRLGLEAENLQHGYSSGLDLRVSLHGGCIYLNDNQVSLRPAPTFPMYLINTGLPETTTGVCIEAAAPYFKTSHIADDFAAVTNAMDAALLNGSLQNIKLAIHENHNLLTQIKVVPTVVNQFITEVENYGGAAKICGAGAVAGNNAGVVLVITDDEHSLAELCARYQYSLLPIQCEARGVHVV